MVYQHVQLVAGLKLTWEQGLLLHGFKVEEDEEGEEYDYPYELMIEEGLTLFRSRGHGEPYFLLGKVIHTYYRFHQKCVNCEEYSCCDTCIGMTNNGFYDTSKMTEEAIQVDLRHLCLGCNHDNKKDMCGLTESRLGLPYQKREENQVRCQVCNRRDLSDFRTPRETFFWTGVGSFVSSRMKKLNKEHKFSFTEDDIQVYYFLDDCLCCT